MKSFEAMEDGPWYQDYDGEMEINLGGGIKATVSEGKVYLDDGPDCTNQVVLTEWQLSELTAIWLKERVQNRFPEAFSPEPEEPPTVYTDKDCPVDEDGKFVCPSVCYGCG